MEEKIKYISLVDNFGETSSEVFGFKESDFYKAVDVFEEAVEFWKHQEDIWDVEDLLNGDCDILKFYDLQHELLGSFQSGVSLEEVEEKLAINTIDYIGYYWDEVTTENGEIVHSIILLKNEDYDGYEGLLSLINQMLEANNISKHAMNISRRIYY